MAAVIKKVPEDFLVKERSEFPIKDHGSHTVFWVKKKSITTLDAVKEIGSFFKIPLTKIKYAGLKDKHAITTQLMTAEGDHKKKISLFKQQDISLEFAGYADRPLGMGLLSGNEFTITVRNIENLPDLKDPVFLNLFGEQRVTQKNVRCGRLLCQKKFEEVAKLLAHDDGALTEILDEHGPVNVLQKVGHRALRLLVNGYQSWLFNQTVLGMVSKDEPLPEKVPLPGFGTESEEVPTIMQELLKEDGVKLRDFIFRRFPKLSSEGALRKTKGVAKDLVVGPLQDDELFEAKKKVTLTFSLGPGSYATEFIRQRFEK